MRVSLGFDRLVQPVYAITAREPAATAPVERPRSATAPASGAGRAAGSYGRHPLAGAAGPAGGGAAAAAAAARLAGAAAVVPTDRAAAGMAGATPPVPLGRGPAVHPPDAGLPALSRVG